MRKEVHAKAKILLHFQNNGTFLFRAFDEYRSFSCQDGDRMQPLFNRKKTVRLPNYEVGYTVLKSANVSVVSRRARRGEHGYIRLEFRRGRPHLPIQNVAIEKKLL